MWDNIHYRLSIWLGRVSWYWLFAGLDTERKNRRKRATEPHLFCSLGGTKPSICGVCRKSLRGHKTYD